MRGGSETSKHLEEGHSRLREEQEESEGYKLGMFKK